MEARELTKVRVLAESDTTNAKAMAELEAARVAKEQEEASRPKAVGPGPFQPDHEAACKDKALTQCRKCKWHNRFDHQNFQTNTQVPNSRRPTVFVNHWCHSCGRVASDQDFGREQSKQYSSTVGDIYLGAKKIHFSLQTHDPRQMKRFQKMWAKNKDNPEWSFNEKEMEEELFRHRFGKRPTLQAILASIPILEQDKIPTDGGLGANPSSGRPGNYSKIAAASETQAVLLDDPSNICVLHEISRNVHTFGTGKGRNTHDALAGDILATWDSKKRKGVSTVGRLYS
jgi:hypothetical protein